MWKGARGGEEAGDSIIGKERGRGRWAIFSGTSMLNQIDPAGLLDNQKLGKYIISLGCPIAHPYSFSGVHVVEINQLLRKKKSMLKKLLLLRFTRPGASASRYFCYCLTFLSSEEWLGFWILFQEGERLPKTCHWIIETEFRLNSLFHYSSIHMTNLVPSWSNERELGTPKHISGAFATSTETAQLSWDTGVKRGCDDSWH